MEEAHGPVGIALAVAEPAAEEAVAARHAVGAIAAARERLSDRPREALAHALVRVEAKHPVVARDRDSVLLLPPEAELLLRLDARAMAQGDCHRVVVAARVDNENLVRKLRAREAGPDLGARVEGDDCDGKW